MRTLLMHCRNFSYEIGELATRPKGISPEPVKERVLSSKDCILTCITVEEGDDTQAIATELADEIRRMSIETGRNEVVLLPFAHLSNKLGSKDEATGALRMLEEKLRSERFSVQVGHYGSHKSLLMDVYGHPGNVRYREI